MRKRNVAKEKTDRVSTLAHTNLVVLDFNDKRTRN